MVQGTKKNVQKKSKKAAKKYLAPTKSRAQAPVKAKRTKDAKVTAAISRNIEQLMAARAAQHGNRLRLIKPPKDSAQWSTKGMKIGNKVDQVRDAKNIKLRAQRNNSIPPPPPPKQ